MAKALLVLGAGLILAGCTTVVHPRVPPTRLGPLGPPDGLVGGETLLSGQMYTSSVGIRDVIGGRFAVTHAFLPTFAVRAEGYYVNDEVWNDGTGAARLGFSVSPVEHLSLHVGGGLGGGAGGAFGGPDAGLALGYVNPYFIPYLSWHASYTAPLGEERVGIVDVSFFPQPTFRHQGNLGFSLPFNPERVNEVAFLFAIGLGQSLVVGEEANPVGQNFRVEDEEVTFSLTWGLSVRLGDPRVRHPNAD